MTIGSPVEKRTWTVTKRELVKMLMAMDRYNVESVVFKTEPDYFNWEIAPTAKRRRRPLRRRSASADALMADTR